MSRLDFLPAPARRVLRGVRRRLAPAPPPPPPPPRPKKFRYVVVVTYGRSGSTLVQGLLNALPHTLVRGENGFYLISLFRAVRDVREFRQLHIPHGARNVKSAFFGLHDVRPREFTRSARTLLRTSLIGEVDPAEVDVLGFKEVAWHRVRADELEPFFTWLDHLMPGCRYVLQERNLDDVVRSGFWKGMDETRVRRKIERVERAQDMLRRTRPDRTLDLRYERVTSKEPAVADAELRALAEFVHGSCDDALLDTLRSTLEVGHGPYPFGASHARAGGQDRPDGEGPTT